MKAALVKQAGQAPVYADFTDPVAANGRVRVKLAASALSHVTKSRASGAHYSSQGTLPFVPGIDGTGTLEDGIRVYFVMPEAPFGGMAEYCLVEAARCIPLPAALGDVTAAPDAVPIRFIEIGSGSAPTINLPSAVIRSTAIELMGSGIGSVPMPRVLGAIAHVLNAAAAAGFQVATQAVPLRDVEAHWTSTEGRARTVFTPT